ncbi:MAG TPA: hypothetical protein VHV75_15105 [Solirubrobacteraceae bacterium]|jgi:cell wall-associated NlpC family hydrolase|nr:hypothetical protein [Solirubrobacteraceae bacterium]
MSFSDAVGQIDQIVQWEQQLANPAALTQATGTGDTATSGDTSSTSATDSSTSTSFANALADAQAQDGSEAISTLDPTATTDNSLLGATDTTGTSSASDLLSGGDSQLLTALSSLSGSDSTDPTDSTDELSALESALGTTGSDSTDSTDSTDELSALESALGTTTASTATSATATNESGPAAGTATSSSDPRIQEMTEEADALVGQPYVWGGGHDGWGPQSGYDCSGFVSAVLHAGGYLSTPQDTTTLPTAAGIESGPGQYVTIYDRDEPGQSGHVIIDIAGQFYESGGEQGSWGGGGGVEQISTPSASYLATFDKVLHPAGL